MGRVFQFGKKIKFWRWVVAWLLNHVTVLNVTELYT